MTRFTISPDVLAMCVQPISAPAPNPRPVLRLTPDGRIEPCEGLALDEATRAAARDLAEHYAAQVVTRIGALEVALRQASDRLAELEMRNATLEAENRALVALASRAGPRH